MPEAYQLHFEQMLRLSLYTIADCAILPYITVLCWNSITSSIWTVTVGFFSCCKKVFLAQKAVIRSMVGAHFTDSCKPLFRQFNILPLPCLYILEVCCYIFQHQEQYTKNADMHNYNTRARNNLHVTDRLLTITRSGVNSIGITLFNKSPLIIRESKTLFHFKSNLKEFLLQRLFYSIDEYLSNWLYCTYSDYIF